MNKTLKPLFACLFSGLICTGAAAAEPQVINIKTDGSSMVMSVTSDGEVLFHHFGGRIDDATPVTGIKSYRRTDHGTDNLAYSTMGGRNFREPALRVTHADGDMNTELRYVSHTTRTLADTNVTRTVHSTTRPTNEPTDASTSNYVYYDRTVRRRNSHTRRTHVTRPPDGTGRRTTTCRRATRYFTLPFPVGPSVPGSEPERPYDG